MDTEYRTLDYIKTDEDLRLYAVEVRRATLEEAAQVCDERARGHFQMSPAAAECDECAAACRALAAKEPVLPDPPEEPEGGGPDAPFEEPVL